MECSQIPYFCIWNDLKQNKGTHEKSPKRSSFEALAYLKTIWMKYTGNRLIELIEFVYIFARPHIPQHTIWKSIRKRLESIRLNKRNFLHTWENQFIGWIVSGSVFRILIVNTGHKLTHYLTGVQIVDGGLFAFRSQNAVIRLIGKFHVFLFFPAQFQMESLVFDAP